jgi:beta-lactamase regulating signal transducer with metallopeptidase domain
MPLLALHPLFHLAGFTGQAFVSGLWQGTVLILAVALALRFLPNLNASVRFAVWAVAFTLATVLPLLPSHMHGVVTARVSSPVLNLNPGWAIAILGLWAVIAAFRIVQLLVGAIRLRTIWHRATPVGSETLTAAGRKVQLCTSADIDAPSVIGFFAPRLLIPATLMPRLSEIELRQIVLHECEHLRRRDDWINLAQKIALAFFPLNPALLWVDRRLGLERELACDAGVVARTSAPFDYAHCLTRLADHRIRSRSIALALSAWSRQSELARRVRTLLAPMRSISPLQTRASLALLSIALLAGAAEIARAPRFVAFTEINPAEALASGIPSSISTALPSGVKVVPAAYELPANAQPGQDRSTVRKISRRIVAPRPRLQQPLLTEASITSPASNELSAGSNAQPQPHAVLTSATQATANQSRRAHLRRTAEPVYAVDDFSPTYAALPFGDGWIIIQL